MSIRNSVGNPPWWALSKGPLHAGLAARQLGLALLAVVGACSDAGNSNPDGESDAVELMQENLTACGLWEPGRLTLHFQTDTEARCIAACFAEHEDCTVAHNYVCQGFLAPNDPDSSLASCIDDCEFFECADGTLTGLFNRCDGHDDCADGSDEEACPPDTTFQCDNGVSVPSEWRCNVEIDCGQGEDELGCESLYFHCADGAVIPNRWECDLTEDCPDGSDEGPTCAHVVCE